MRTYWFYENLESMGKTKRLRKPKEVHICKNETEAFNILNIKPRGWCFVHVTKKEMKS